MWYLVCTYYYIKLAKKFCIGQYRMLTFKIVIFNGWKSRCHVETNHLQMLMDIISFWSIHKMYSVNWLWVQQVAGHGRWELYVEHRPDFRKIPTLFCHDMKCGTRLRISIQVMALLRSAKLNIIWVTCDSLCIRYIVWINQF